jgi:phosphatidylserine/phosphatidylglycerophosphate/cardiolipin synthase-like enzyme
MKCDPVAGSHNIDGRTAQSSVEVGLAVESEVKEIKRMLRSFMAKLSMRDMRDRNALEWRTVALALDRLFFIIYLVIIILALGAVLPWQEAMSAYRPSSAQVMPTSDTPDPDTS